MCFIRNACHDKSCHITHSCTNVQIFLPKMFPLYIFSLHFMYWQIFKSVVYHSVNALPQSGLWWIRNLSQKHSVQFGDTPWMGCRPSHNTMRTLVHTLIHTLEQFSVAKPPTGHRWWDERTGEPGEYGENMQKKKKPPHTHTHTDCNPSSGLNAGAVRQQYYLLTNISTFWNILA